MNFWNSLGQLITVMGGATIIATSFTAWFSKHLANRNLEKIKFKFQSSLEEQKAQNTQEITRLNNDLAILREKTLATHRDKIELYRTVIEPLIDFINQIECEQNISQDKLVEFNHQRLRLHSQLVLFAPQAVLDAYDHLVDYIFDSLERKVGYNWSEVRGRGLSLLNKMRTDIGIAQGDILYQGKR